MFALDVEWAYDNGIMIGVSDTEWAPLELTNTAMAALTLARMLSVNLDEYASAGDAWYSAAVAWAAEIDPESFGSAEPEYPELPIDRGSLATAISRFLRQANSIAAANSTAPQVTSFSDFTDFYDMTAQERDAFSTLHALGIIKGKGGGVMDPRGYVTRAELAAILHRSEEHFATEQPVP